MDLNDFGNLDMLSQLVERKEEELPPEVVELLTNHKELTTSKQYERYQRQYHEFCKEKKLEPISEPALLGFFASRIHRGYAASTMWAMYSAIAEFYLISTGQKMTIFPRIQVMLKKYQAEAPPPKKANVFSESQMEEILYGQILSEPMNLARKWLGFSRILGH